MFIFMLITRSTENTGSTLDEFPETAGTNFAASTSNRGGSFDEMGRRVGWQRRVGNSLAQSRQFQ
jgi:hypothetical protein